MNNGRERPVPQRGYRSGSVNEPGVTAYFHTSIGERVCS